MLSLFIPTAGHGYIGNWERGLVIGGAAIGTTGLGVLFVTQGKEPIDGLGSVLCYVAVGLRLYEVADAAIQASKFNQTLYKRIFGTDLPTGASP